MVLLDQFFAQNTNLRSKVTNIAAKIGEVRSKVKSRSVSEVLYFLAVLGIKMHPGVFFGAEFESGTQKRPMKRVFPIYFASDTCNLCCRQACNLCTLYQKKLS